MDNAKHQLGIEKSFQNKKINLKRGFKPDFLLLEIARSSVHVCIGLGSKDQNLIYIHVVHG